MEPAVGLVFRPLTRETWPDLVELFGPRGGCGGCWCMAWRRSGAEFRRGKGAGNRRALQAVVRRGEPVGVLAYGEGRPVGWCAVAPRGAYRRLQASRVLAPVDDVPVWSVTCLFVARGWRRRGVGTALARAAAEYAAAGGAPSVEAYPTETGTKLPDAFVWTGLPSQFREAGFTEVARRSPRRPVLRWTPAAGGSRRRR